MRKAARVLLKINTIGSFICGGLTALIFLILIFVSGSIPVERIKLYNVLLTLILVSCVILFISGFLSKTYTIYITKKGVILRIVFGFITLAPLLIVGSFLWLNSKEEPEYNESNLILNISPLFQYLAI